MTSRAALPATSRPLRVRRRRRFLAGVSARSAGSALSCDVVPPSNWRASRPALSRLRPRGRSRDRAGREARQFDGGTTSHDKADPADRAETPARNRRRRRTRSGREVAGSAAREVIVEVHPESDQQAS